LTGIAASEGIAFGKAYLLDRRSVKTPKYRLLPEEVPDEVVRFRTALKTADQQLRRLMERLEGVGGQEHTLVLQAHQLILQDEHLVEKTVRIIQQQQINSEWALERTVEELKDFFEQVEDAYLRQRQDDVSFVATHALNALTGTQRNHGEMPRDAIVVTDDLSPAETAQLYRSRVNAFATDAGGRNSHTAIVARSLAIPAVVGLKRVTSVVGDGDELIIDGYRGELLIQPDEETVRRYQRRIKRRAQDARGLARERELPAETLDGVHVSLMANIELSDEIHTALAYGAEGIGLYRTEFLYLGRDEMPTEEAHLADASQVLQLSGPWPVTFRTCDLGADKIPGFVGATAEINPALGMRSIRLCLDRLEMFKAQLCGLLRAAGQGGMRIMFPMVAGLEDLRMTKHILNQCIEDLRQRGIAVPPVPVGVMVEMPSAAVTADLLAQEAEFFAIGTNDLTQYALAIDRSNEQVNDLFLPFYPAILRLIRQVVRAAEGANIPLSVCGEMAGDPLMTLVLLGLGVRDLSMSAQAIPVIKRLIRGTTIDDARMLAKNVLTLSTPQEVEVEILTTMEAYFPDLSSTAASEWNEDTVVE